MSQQVDSRTLFIKQVEHHTASLCELLACDTMEPAPSAMIERCAVSTRMLAGTSSLMGCEAWERALTSFEELLFRYGESGFRWDDRIAQVTSELIEREEMLVSAYASDASTDLSAVADPDGLVALCDEMATLQEAIAAAVREAPPEAQRGAPNRGAPNRGAPDCDAPDCDADGPPEEDPEAASAMAGVAREVREITRTLVRAMESGAFARRDWESPEIADIRTQLCYLEFYACAVAQMIDRRSGDSPVPQCALRPLSIVLTDFANEISGSGERTLDIVLSGDETMIDPRLLPTVGAVLQRMITDVFNRSEGEALAITIRVGERGGALLWQLSDNGNNFISDSRLDHEDQLAFYPALREARKMLGRYHGVLWVEPRHDREVRFSFTTPSSTGVESFIVWGENQRAFAVRSVQLCDLVPSGTAPKGEDSFGEFLTIDNRRVPLFSLDVIFKEAPSKGEMIAVIGSLERRVGFYVPDSGALRQGKTVDAAIPVWQGPEHLVAEIDGKPVALIDADKILQVYMELMGGLSSEGTSGGVVEDESEVASGQAPYDSDKRNPPDNKSREAEDGVDVLVVEQSESLRAALDDILGRHRIRTMFAGETGEAIDMIRRHNPGVVVSEFRMPTMAAKRIVETMNREGISIPVLVTTSQSGRTADLLVEKLGVAGYLSKPLSAEQVTARIVGLLGEKAPVE